MEFGIYHIGKNRIVINDHTTKEEIEKLKKAYPQLDTSTDDNNIKESSIDSKTVSKPRQSKRTRGNKSKA